MRRLTPVTWGYFAISFRLGMQPTVHHAAAIGDTPLLERMLAADPALLGPTAAGGRWRITPLHAAVIAGNGKSVAFLLGQDVPVDAQNHNGHTALALTAEYPANGSPRTPICQTAAGPRCERQCGRGASWRNRAPPGRNTRRHRIDGIAVGTWC